MAWITLPRRNYRPPYVDFDVKLSNATRLGVGVRLVLIARAGHEPKPVFLDRVDQNLKRIRSFMARDLIHDIMDLEISTVKTYEHAQYSEIVVNLLGPRAVVAHSLRHIVKYVKMCQTPFDRNFRPERLERPKQRPVQLALPISSSYAGGICDYANRHPPYQSPRSRHDELVTSSVADDTFYDV